MTVNPTDNEHTPHIILDPRLLGRPIHLLGSFASRFRRELNIALHSGQNRRYWSSLEVADVSIARHDFTKWDDRWISYPSEAGIINFSLDRWVLLAILEQRYSRQDQKKADPELMAVTATEERLAALLGRQLIQFLMLRLEIDAQPAEMSSDSCKFALNALPGRDCWAMRIALTQAQDSKQGVLWLTFDEEWLALMLKRLAPASAKPASVQPAPLTTSLQVRVSASSVIKEIALGELTELRAGDIIPINLCRTDVLLEGTRLFTAAIADNKGKLCLTSFEDID